MIESRQSHCKESRVQFFLAHPVYTALQTLVFKQKLTCRVYMVYCTALYFTIPLLHFYGVIKSR